MTAPKPKVPKVTKPKVSKKLNLAVVNDDLADKLEVKSTVESPEIRDVADLSEKIEQAIGHSEALITRVDLLKDDKVELKRKIDELSLTAAISLYKYMIKSLSKYKSMDLVGIKIACGALESLNRSAYKVLHVANPKVDTYSGGNDSLNDLIDILQEKIEEVDR